MADVFGFQLHSVTRAERYNVHSWSVRTNEPSETTRGILQKGHRESDQLRLRNSYFFELYGGQSRRIDWNNSCQTMSNNYCTSYSGIVKEHP